MAPRLPPGGLRRRAAAFVGLPLSALIGLTAATLPPTPAQAAEALPEGFLCCNLRTDGRWISDINYAEGGKRMLPVGTPLKVTGYGRYRVHVDIDGKPQDLGNDYSRDLDLTAFARRYVVPDDPRRRLAGFAPRIQQAIANARLLPGMTREQVLMAVGYPVSSENPHLDARLWRYWLSTFSEFRVHFDDEGKVARIEADPNTRSRIVAE